MVVCERRFKARNFKNLTTNKITEKINKTDLFQRIYYP